MATSASALELLDPAIDALVSRWRLSPRAAALALFDAAQELGVEIGDLAALVLADEHQRRAQGSSGAGRRPVRGRARRLRLVV